MLQRLLTISRGLQPQHDLCSTTRNVVACVEDGRQSRRRGLRLSAAPLCAREVRHNVCHLAKPRPLPHVPHGLSRARSPRPRTATRARVERTPMRRQRPGTIDVRLPEEGQEAQARTWRLQCGGGSLGLRRSAQQVRAKSRRQGTCRRRSGQVDADERAAPHGRLWPGPGGGEEAANTC